MTNFLPILTGAVPGDYVGAINGVIQGINSRITDGTFGGGGLSNPVTVAQGGTGVTSAQAAIQALTGRPEYYAANYGVLSDGIELTDVTTTSDSAVISSASYTFVTADIGKRVNMYAGTPIVMSAGVTTAGSHVITVADTTGVTIKSLIVGTGIPAGAYVTQVNSATKLVISTQCSATGSGLTITTYPFINTVINSVAAGAATLAANAGASLAGTARIVFGTDDLTALNALVTTINNAGTGGTIKLPAGITVISNGLRIYSKVSVVGVGRESTTLMMLTNTQSQGTLYIAGYTATNLAKDIAVMDLTIDNSKTASVSYSANLKAMDVSFTERLLVTRTYMHGTSATIVGLDNEKNGITVDNVFENGGIMNDGTQPGGNGIGDGIGTVANLSQSGVIANNTIRNVRRRAIMLEQQGGGTDLAAHYVINGNVIYMTTGNECGISDSGGIGNLITSNIIYNPTTTGNGIALDSGTLAAGLPPPGGKALVANNIIYGGAIGILFDATVVAGGGESMFINNRVISPATYGLNVNTNASTALVGLTIRGLHVSDCTGGAAVYLTGSGGITDLNISAIKVRNTANGVYIFTPVTRLKMHDVYVYADGGSGSGTTSPIVVKTYAVTGAQVSDCYQFGCATPTINKVTGGTLTGVVTNMVGFSAFTVSGSSAGTPLGQADRGTFVAGTAGANTVTITFGALGAATTGWIVEGICDLTTNANSTSWAQTASTSTSATISGTAALNDVILFSARPY